MAKLTIHAALGTNLGLKRSSNEDMGFCGHGVYIVCDGMGGGVGGGMASHATIERFKQLDKESVRLRDSIIRTIERAQEDVLHIGRKLGGLSGTTLTGLIAPQSDGQTVTSAGTDHHAWYVVNVGDSRTYHIKLGVDGLGLASSFSQVTRDHSKRQKAIDME